MHLTSSIVFLNLVVEARKTHGHTPRYPRGFNRACSRCAWTHRNTTAPPAGVRAGRGFPGGLVWVGGWTVGHLVKIGSYFFVGGFYHHLKATPFEQFFLIHFLI